MYLYNFRWSYSNALILGFSPVFYSSFCYYFTHHYPPAIALPPFLTCVKFLLSTISSFFCSPKSRLVYLRIHALARYISQSKSKRKGFVVVLSHRKQTKKKTLFMITPSQSLFVLFIISMHMPFCRKLSSLLNSSVQTLVTHRAFKFVHTRQHARTHVHMLIEWDFVNPRRETERSHLVLFSSAFHLLRAKCCLFLFQCLLVIKRRAMHL